MSDRIVEIVEHDGKTWQRTTLPSGAVIETEIRPPEPAQPPKLSDRALLERIAVKLNVDLTP